MCIVRKLAQYLDVSRGKPEYLSGPSELSYCPTQWWVLELLVRGGRRVFSSTVYSEACLESVWFLVLSLLFFGCLPTVTPLISPPDFFRPPIRSFLIGAMLFSTPVWGNIVGGTCGIEIFSGSSFSDRRFSGHWFLISWILLMSS